MRRFFSVRNFERFQHYNKSGGKPGRPVWIKLYRDLLMNFDFMALPDTAKAHLVLIWLLASQLNNRVPYDAKWVAARIGAQSPVDLRTLESAEFITLESAQKSVSDLCSSDSALSPDLASDPDPDPEQEIVGTPTRASARDTLREEPFADFALFWRLYPRKDGKQYAAQCWKKLTGDERTLATADVPQRITANWAGRELDKIPHASTYINQRRWLDELTANARLPDPQPHFSPGMDRLAQSYRRRLEEHERSGGSQVTDADQSELVQTVGRPTGGGRMGGSS